MNKTTRILIVILAISVAAVCVCAGYAAVKSNDDTTTTVATVNPTEESTTEVTTTETTTEKVITLAELLLGKWSDSAGMSGFEFFEDGKVSFTYVNLNALGLNFDGKVDNGTYTLNGDKLNIAYSIYTATIDKTYRITIEDDVLEMYDIEELKTSKYVRTDKFETTEVTTTGVSVSDELFGSWESKPLSKTYKFTDDGKVVVAIDGEGFDGVYVTEDTAITIQYTAYSKKITEKYNFAVSRNTLSLTDEQGTFTFNRMGTTSETYYDEDLLGVWRDSANLSGYEFKDGGVVSVTFVNIRIPVIDVPVNGTYTGGYEIKDGVLSLTYYIYGKEIKDSYTYEVSGNSLKMKNTENGNLSTYIKQ